MDAKRDPSVAVPGGEDDELKARCTYLERRVLELEAAVRESEQSRRHIEGARRAWTAALDAIRAPVFLHDADGLILRANRDYAERAGVDFADLIGKPYWEVFPRRLLPGCRPSTKSGTGSRLVEHDIAEDIVIGDGTVFSNRTHAIEDKDGNYLYSLHIMTDVTDQRLIEISLREREDRFQSVANAAQDAVILLDVCGRVAFWNNAAERLFGYMAGEALGRELDELIIPVRYRDRHKRGVERFRAVSADGLSGRTVEVAALRKDGTEFPVELSLSRARLRDGWTAIGIVRDITERKRHEEQQENHAEQLQAVLVQTIEAVALTIEKRDPYTAGHQQRVAHLGALIGREMGLSADQIDGVFLGGLIHDIGKIYIPTEILNRPGKISDMEFGLIQSHAQVGYDILKEVEFPWPLADIVLQHHERLDGTGYPNGLKAPGIIPEARVIAVADVVEAMASHRPYRASLGDEAAMEEIAKHAGTRYDPDVVECCIWLFREHRFSLT